MSDKDGQGQVQGLVENQTNLTNNARNFQQIQPQELPDKKGNIGKVIGLSVFALIIGLLIGSSSLILSAMRAQTNKDMQRIKHSK